MESRWLPSLWRRSCSTAKSAFVVVVVVAVAAFRSSRSDRTARVLESAAKPNSSLSLPSPTHSSLDRPSLPMGLFRKLTSRVSKPSPSSNSSPSSANYTAPTSSALVLDAGQENLLRALAKHDTVLVVDDSGSMKGGPWHDVAAALSSLVRVAADYDVRFCPLALSQPLWSLPIS